MLWIPPTVLQITRSPIDPALSYTDTLQTTGPQIPRAGSIPLFYLPLRLVSALPDGTTRRDQVSSRPKGEGEKSTSGLRLMHVANLKKRSLLHRDGKHDHHWAHSECIRIFSSAIEMLTTRMSYSCSVANAHGTITTKARYLSTSKEEAKQF